MRRGLKLGMGIPAVVIGLFVTIGGVVLMVLVGPDGRFTLPRNEAESSGHALIFDALSLRGMATSGSTAATVHLSVEQSGTGPVFVGIGPSAQVQAYLQGVATDRIVQVNWPGGVRTERLPGASSRQPGPPAGQRFWVASDQGTAAAFDWVAASGDWTVVVMNANASEPVRVTGSVTLSVPALGPICVALLLVGLVLLIGGSLLTASGARMPTRRSASPPPRPDRVAA